MSPASPDRAPGAPAGEAREALEPLRARYAGLPLAQRMANWFDLSRMFGTVWDILLSEVFRDRFDYRQLQSAHSDRSAAQRPLPSSSGSDASIEGGDARLAYEDYASRPGCLDDDGCFWFDYVADVGDGFSSTYHVAQTLAQPQLSVLPPERRPANKAPEEPFVPSLRRGSLLILGGDQVYPSASRERYEERFIKPYEAAAYQPVPPARDALPHLFAVPGNHDWYDGLGAFMSVFAEQRAIGLWRTRQRRSYFALRLPHGFWLFAVDVALSGELDIDQVNYFEERVAKDVHAGERIILCLPEPDWAKPRPLTQGSRDALFYLQRRIAEAAGGRDIQVVLRIAGDLHHYRRHMSIETVPGQPPRQVPNLTAGGGGAFLHPTHDGAEHGTVLRSPSAPSQPVEFACRPAWCFPHPAVSRALTRRNVLFGLRNWRLWTSLTLLYMGVFYLWFVSFQGDGGRRALLLGVLFTLLFYSLKKLAAAGGDSIPLENLRRPGPPEPDVSGEHGPGPKSTWPATLRGMLHGLLQSLVLAFGLTGVWSVLSAALGQKLATLVHGGPLPEATQAAIFRFCFLQDTQFAPMAGFADQGFSLDAVRAFSYELLHNLGVLLSLLGRLFVQAGITAFLSLLTFGLYLWVSLNRHRVHCNDAFAALRCPDYKNFLRICLKPDGLVVYPIGFRASPKQWDFAPDTLRQAPSEGAPLFLPRLSTPQEAAACAPRLIEAPIVVSRHARPVTSRT